MEGTGAFGVFDDEPGGGAKAKASYERTASNKIVKKITALDTATGDEITKVVRNVIDGFIEFDRYAAEMGLDRAVE